MDWVDELWGATAAPPEHDWVDDLWGSDEDAFRQAAGVLNLSNLFTPPSGGLAPAAPAVVEEEDPGDYDPLGFGGLPDQPPPNPWSIINPNARRFSDLSPQEQLAHVRQQQIRQEQDPRKRAGIIDQTSRQEAAEHAQAAAAAENAPDPRVAAIVSQMEDDRQQARQLAADAQSSAHAVNANKYLVDNLRSIHENDLRAYQEAVQDLEKTTAADNALPGGLRTQEAGMKYLVARNAERQAKDSGERYNRYARHVAGQADQVRRNLADIEALTARTDAAHLTLGGMLEEQPWLTMPKTFRESVPSTHSREQIDQVAAAVEAAPEGPERDQLSLLHAKMVQHNAQVRRDVDEATKRGMTWRQSAEYEAAGADLDRSKMAGGSVTSTLGFRIPETLVHQIGGGLANILTTAGVEAGAPGAELVRRNLRAFQRNMALYQEQADKASSVPGAGYIRQAGAAVGEALLAAGTGGLPALIGYYGANTTADSLAQADEEGRTGWRKYAPAAAHGTIESLMTYLGGRYWGAGTGVLAGGRGGIDDALAQRILRGAARRNLGPALTRLAVASGKAFSGAGGEVFEEVTTELQHYLVDKAGYGDNYAGAPLHKRLLNAAIVAGLAGGASGAAHGITAPIRDELQAAIRELAEQTEAREADIRRAATEYSGRPAVTNPETGEVISPADAPDAPEVQPPDQLSPAMQALAEAVRRGHVSRRDLARAGIDPKHTKVEDRVGIARKFLEEQAAPPQPATPEPEPEVAAEPTQPFYGITNDWQRLPPGTPTPDHPAIEVLQQPDGVYVRRAQPAVATPFADKPLVDMNRGELVEAAEALGVRHKGLTNKRLREKLARAFQESPTPPAETQPQPEAVPEAIPAAATTAPVLPSYQGELKSQVAADLNVPVEAVNLPYAQWAAIRDAYGLGDLETARQLVTGQPQVTEEVIPHGEELQQAEESRQEAEAQAQAEGQILTPPVSVPAAQQSAAAVPAVASLDDISAEDLKADLIRELLGQPAQPEAAATTPSAAAEEQKTQAPAEAKPAEKTTPSAAAELPPWSRQPHDMSLDEWLAATRFYRSGKTKNAELPTGERVILKQENTAANFRENSRDFLELLWKRTVVEGKGLTKKKLTKPPVTIQTNTGRDIPAPPQIRLDSNRKAAADYVKQHKWLLEQGIAEAEARGDDYNLTWMRGETVARGGLPPATVDSLNEYLFGETDPKWDAQGKRIVVGDSRISEPPPVQPDITKPLVAPPAAPQDAELGQRLDDTVNLRRVVKQYYDTDDVDVVEPANDLERRYAEKLASLGQRAVFFRQRDPQTRVNGFADTKNNRVFLRSGDSADALASVVYHELSHATGFDKASRAAAKEVVEGYAKQRYAKASPKYQERMASKDAAGNLAFTELGMREGVAELIGRAARDPKVREQLERDHPTLWQEIKRIILEVLGELTPEDKVIAEFANYLRQQEQKKGLTKKPAESQVGQEPKIESPAKKGLTKSQEPTPPESGFGTAAQKLAELFKKKQQQDGGDVLLSEEGGRRTPITDTPSFKRWFGDSKVVDKDGKPLVVYHGTNSPTTFSVFKSHGPRSVYRLNGKEITKADSWDMGDDYQGMPDGYHYGAITDALTMGANKALEFRVREANKYKREDGSYSPDTTRHLNDLRRLRNGKLTTSTEVRPNGNAPWFTPSPNYSFVRDIGNYNDGRVLPVYLSIKNPKWVNQAEIESAGYGFNVEKYKAQGYDGVIFAPDRSDLTRDSWGDSTQIVAFSPTQIKSATGNRGTFDPGEANILLSEEPPARDPELVAAAVDLVVEYVKAGGKSFREFVQKTIQAIGRDTTLALDTLLREAWESVRKRFSSAGLDASVPLPQAIGEVTQPPPAKKGLTKPRPGQQTALADMEQSVGRQESEAEFARPFIHRLAGGPGKQQYAEEVEGDREWAEQYRPMIAFIRERARHEAGQLPVEDYDDSADMASSLEDALFDIVNEAAAEYMQDDPVLPRNDEEFGERDLTLTEMDAYEELAADVSVDVARKATKDAITELMASPEFKKKLDELAKNDGRDWARDEPEYAQSLVDLTAPSAVEWKAIVGREVPAERQAAYLEGVRETLASTTKPSSHTPPATAHPEETPQPEPPPEQTPERIAAQSPADPAPTVPAESPAVPVVAITADDKPDLSALDDTLLRKVLRRAESKEKRYRYIYFVEAARAELDRRGITKYTPSPPEAEKQWEAYRAASKRLDDARQNVPHAHTVFNGKLRDAVVAAARSLGVPLRGRGEYGLSAAKTHAKKVERAKQEAAETEPVREAKQAIADAENEVKRLTLEAEQAQREYDRAAAAGLPRVPTGQTRIALDGPSTLQVLNFDAERGQYKVSGYGGVERWASAQPLLDNFATQEELDAIDSVFVQVNTLLRERDLRRSEELKAAERKRQAERDRQLRKAITKEASEKAYWRDVKRRAKAIKGKAGEVAVLTQRDDKPLAPAEILTDKWAITENMAWNAATGEYIRGALTGNKNDRGFALTHIPTGTVAASHTSAAALKELFVHGRDAGLDWSAVTNDPRNMPKEWLSLGNRVIRAWKDSALLHHEDADSKRIIALAAPATVAGQADTVLTGIDLAVGTAQEAPGIRLVRELADAVPEFRYDPVFTVDSQKNLVFRDGYKITLDATHFGLDTDELTPGQTVGINIQDLGIKPATEQDVVAEMLAQHGFGKVSRTKDGNVSASWGGVRVRVTRLDKHQWTSSSDRASKVLDRIRWVQPGQADDAPSRGGKGPSVGQPHMGPDRPLVTEDQGLPEYFVKRLEKADDLIDILIGDEATVEARQAALQSLTELDRKLAVGILSLQDAADAINGRHAKASKTGFPPALVSADNPTKEMYREIGKTAANMVRWRWPSRTPRALIHRKDSTKDSGWMASDRGIRGGGGGKYRRGATPPPWSSGVPESPSGYRRFDTTAMVQLLRRLKVSPRIRRMAALGRGGTGGVWLQERIFWDADLAERVLGHEIGHFVDLAIDIVGHGKKFAKRLAPLKTLKRKLSKTLRVQAKALSRAWRGDFKDGDKYRDTAKELYADFMSAMFRHPGWVERNYPELHAAFQDLLNAKPDFAAAYEQIDNWLTGHTMADEIIVQGEQEVRETFDIMLTPKTASRASFSDRVKFGLMTMWGRAYEKEGKPRELGTSIAYDELEYSGMFAAKEDALVADDYAKRVEPALAKVSDDPVKARSVLHSYSKAQRTIHEVRAAGEWIRDHAEAARFMLEEVADAINMSGWRHAIDTAADAELYDVAAAMFREVHERNAAKAAARIIDDLDMGVDGGAALVAFNVRGKLLNPGGLTVDAARQVLDRIERRLGPDRYAALNEAAGELRQLIYDTQRKMYEEGLISKKVWDEIIQPNKDNYVPYAVLDYFDGRVSAGVLPQKGTALGVADVSVATQLKIASSNILRQKQRQVALLLKAYQAGGAQASITQRLRRASDIDRIRREHLHDNVSRAVLWQDGAPYLVEFSGDDGKLLEAAIANPAFHEHISWISELTGVTQGIMQVWTQYNMAFMVHSNPKRGARTAATRIGFRKTGKQLTQGLAKNVMLATNYAEAAFGAPMLPEVRELVDKQVLMPPRLSQAMVRDAANLRALMENHTILAHRVRNLVGTDAPPWWKGGRLGRRAAKVTERVFTGYEAFEKIYSYYAALESGMNPAKAAAVARRGGIPKPGVGGKWSLAMEVWYPWTRVNMQGIRATLDILRDPTIGRQFAMRFALFEAAPRVAKVAIGTALVSGAVGWLLGDGDDDDSVMVEVMRRISPYKLALDDVVPLYFYDPRTGQIDYFWNWIGRGSKVPKHWEVVSIRIPGSEEGRLWGALLYNLMSHAPRAKKDLGRPGVTMFRAAGQWATDQLAPNLSPIIATTKTLSDMVLTGRNPEDPFRGQPSANPLLFDAGGVDRAQAIAGYVLNQLSTAGDVAGVLAANFGLLDDRARNAMSRRMPGDYQAWTEKLRYMGVSHDNYADYREYKTSQIEEDTVRAKAQLVLSHDAQSLLRFYHKYAKRPRTPNERLQYEIAEDFAQHVWGSLRDSNSFYAKAAAAANGSPQAKETVRRDVDLAAAPMLAAFEAVRRGEHPRQLPDRVLVEIASDLSDAEPRLLQPGKKTLTARQGEWLQRHQEALQLWREAGKPEYEAMKQALVADRKRRGYSTAFTDEHGNYTDFYYRVLRLRHLLQHAAAN